MTKEETIELALKEMPPNAANFHWGKVSPELKEMFKKHYRNLDIARAEITAESKLRKAKARWPIGWWDHVDPEPLFEKKAAQLTERDKAMLLRLCEEARSTHAQPHITAEEMTRISNLGSPLKVLGGMGIPYIKNPGTLKRMTAYWKTPKKHDSIK